MTCAARGFFTALFAFAISLSPVQAVDYELIGNSWSEEGEKLLKIDFTSGAVTPFATMSTPSVMGIAYSESGDFLYATTTHIGTPQKLLLKVNRFTGATISSHLVGFESFNIVAEGDVAVQKSTGHVFSMRSRGTISVWDPVTQEIVRIMENPAFEFADTTTLAFNAAGELFMIDPKSKSADPGRIYKLDPATSAILSSAPLSTKIGVVGGMAFHPDTDQAFVTDYCISDNEGADVCTGSHLYLIDVNTGQLDLIGPTSIGTSGIAFVPVFTAPSLAPDIAVTIHSGELADGQTTHIVFDQNRFGGGSSTFYDIRNHAVSDPLIVTQIVLPEGFSVFPAVFPITIAPGQTHSFSITSTGPLQQVYSGQVHILSNDADEADFEFPIRAPYNTPDIEINSFFGEITDGEAYPARETTWGSPAGIALYLLNNNQGPLIVSGINLPPGFSFAGTPPTFPITVNQNGPSAEVRIQLTAASPGSYSGTVTILSNDFDESPFEILVSGMVSENSITFQNLSDSMIEGGSISANAFGADLSQPTYEWDLDSDGQFDATGQTIQLPNTDGPGSLPVSVKISDSLSSIIRSSTVAITNRDPVPTVAGPFSVPANVPLTLDLAAADAPVDLAAGMTWKIDWGDSSMTTTAPGQPATFSLTHTYTQPGQSREILVTVTDKDGASGTNSWFVAVTSGVIGVFDGADASGQELIDGVSNLSFDNATFGNPVSQTITLLNRSSNPATIGPISLPAGFSLVNAPLFPLTLAPFATQMLEIRFAADRFGQIAETLSISTSDPAMPSFEITLTADITAPDISLQSSSREKTFENGTGVWSDTASVGSTFSDRILTLFNENSSVPLTVTAINLPPGYSLIDPPDFPLILGGENSDSSVNLTLAVNTATAGVLKGRLEIISDDPDENPFSLIVITKIGDQPDLIVLREDSADQFFDSYMEGGKAVIFNGQTVSLTGSSISLRLHNQGNQPLTIQSLTVPAGFSFAAPPTLPAVLNPSESFNLTLNASADAQPGNLVITNTDPDENPYLIALSDAATDPATPTISNLSLVHPANGNPATFSATLSGVPGTTLILEASTDLGATDPWTPLGETTLDPSGQGQFLNIPDPGTASPPARRNFYRLRSNP